MKRLFSVLLFGVFALARIATAQTDQIPPSQITWIEPELSAFAVTTSVTDVEIGLGGVNIAVSPDKLNGPNRWPNQVTPGWDGPLQYSVGFVFQVGGQWYASAPIEHWQGRRDGSGPIQDQSVQCPNAPIPGHGQIHCNLFYAPNWGSLSMTFPREGDSFGVFVASGDVRNHFYGGGVRERSNIVLVALPAQGQARTFHFDVEQPAVQPPNPPVVSGGQSPQPGPAPTYDEVLRQWARDYMAWARAHADSQDAQIAALQIKADEILNKQELAFQNLSAQHREAAKASGGGGNPFAFLGSGDFWMFITKYILPALGAGAAAVAVTNK